ncbi:helix-turn-helix transcriptional regulator [Stappia sp. F7233]|uniref:Helix-turn-helix transcriptional regulator n=1 Tax=Stappia albiluteola TaxID=2758565 RepID=A0A839AC57_9HYPH|nr:helix-turn-helix domain-containing protein [Stappia albiluteola]MBA5777223.1 helix-turn-helix transcriptional regulator [Stappia albiluteola]
MKKAQALEALAALGQETRLDVFRLLVKAGDAGLAAGEIAARLDVRANTLSSHLSILQRAGLIRQAREGRSLRYRADYAGMLGLLSYLLEDCCGGRPEICAPLGSLCIPANPSC